MLSPDERSVLLDALRPPPSMVLDAGVATTFTLDLAAALVPPLAFAAVELRRTDDPIAALHSVRACGNRLDVFHQAGQIAVPLRASRLVAYLEPMIHAVRRPRPGYLFHPKVWFLRYRDPDSDETAHRLVCLTRNLTQDQSWDAVLRLDGRRQGRPDATNRPVADFIRGLPSRAVTELAADRVERIESLAEDARRVAWEFPEDVTELAFHFLDGTRGRHPDFRGRRHLIVAPFLTDTGVGIVAPASSSVTAVSRPESFDGLAPATVRGLTRYVLLSMPALDDPDDEDEAGGPEPRPFGLHAKVVVVERGHRAHVFVGSANATAPAFGGNVEFVVELIGCRARLGIDAILGPGPEAGTRAGLRPYLEEYHGLGGQVPDPEEAERRRIDAVLREVAELDWRVDVTSLGPERYRLAVATRQPVRVRSSDRISVELLTRPGVAVPVCAGQPFAGTFDGVPLADVTPFLAVRITAPGGEASATVVRGGIHGDPPHRHDRVLAGQIDSAEKFLRFLALLLGLDDAPTPGADGLGPGGAESIFGRVAAGGGILEAMLRALADHPRTLLDLDRLVTDLARTAEGRAVLPDGFADLWPTIMAAQRSIMAVQRCLASPGTLT